MSKTKHIVLGWGLVGSAIIGAGFGLPVLADASTSVKEQVRWQDRAETFQSAQLAASEDAYSASEFAARIAGLQLDQSYGTIWQRDRALAGETAADASPMIAKAKHNAREVQCLAEAVYYEARSETRAGQKAVAEVVLNRVDHKAFPNTVCGVVYEGAERTTGCQFSFTCDGSTAKIPSGKTWARSQDIAKHMMLGASAPVTWRSTHYHTTDVNPVWAGTLRQTRQFDTHVFYRFMPRKSLLRSVSVAP